MSQHLSIEEDTEIRDITVIGAGPVGLITAFWAGMREASSRIIDSLPDLGGQLTTLYPEKWIYDVAALPAVTGRNLVENLIRQAEMFDPLYLLGEQARSVVPEQPAAGVQPRWSVGTDLGRRIGCGAIVITGGIGRFTPRPLEAAAAWEGRGLTYHVPTLEEHARRDVVIVGGGDSAVDWALALNPIASSVTVIHRRARFRAHEASMQQLRQSTCAVITDAHVQAARGDDRLRRIVVRHAFGDRSELPVDALIGALGFTADLGPLKSWGSRSSTAESR